MAYCWLIPLAMAALPFTTSNYGGAGAWCSITSLDMKSLEWGTFWRFAIIYVPLWICIAVNLYMYFRVYRALRGHEAAMAAYAEPEEEGGSAVEAEDESAMVAEDSGRRIGPRGVEQSTSTPIIARLQLYTLALVVCWSWATVNRVREAIHPDAHAIFWLYILQYMFQVSDWQRGVPPERSCLVKVATAGREETLTLRKSSLLYVLLARSRTPRLSRSHANIQQNWKLSLNSRAIAPTKFWLVY